MSDILSGLRLVCSSCEFHSERFNFQPISLYGGFNAVYQNTKTYLLRHVGTDNDNFAWGLEETGEAKIKEFEEFVIANCGEDEVKIRWEDDFLTNAICPNCKMLLRLE